MPKVGDIEETLENIGASEGIRTLDTHVGNVMLYQAELRSLPATRVEPTEIREECKPLLHKLRWRSGDSRCAGRAAAVVFNASERTGTPDEWVCRLV